MLLRNNKVIERSIINIETEKYKDTANIADIFYSLNKTIESVAGLIVNNESIRLLREKIAKVSEEINNNTNNFKNLSDRFNELYLKSNLPSINILDNSELMKSIKKLNETVKESSFSLASSMILKDLKVDNLNKNLSDNFLYNYSNSINEFKNPKLESLKERLTIKSQEVK